MLKRLSSIKGIQRLVKEEDLFSHFFNSFFDDFLVQNFDCDSQFNSFKVDILEDKDCYWLEADLPGFQIHEITISYEKAFLTITAQRMTNVTRRTEQVIRKERQQGIFSRSFQIENILENQIDKHLSNGILTIKIPKDKTNYKSYIRKDETR